jgi:hypothetical protein
MDIGKFYKKRVRNISEILESNADDFTEEAVHKLRVEIKKIKAAFALISSIKKNFHKKKYFHPFKILFDKAGRLRTIQIDKKYVPILEDSETDACHQLYRTIGKELKKRSIAYQKGDILKIAKSISKGDIRKYVSGEEKKLNKLFKTKSFNEAELHIVRKRLKSFYLLTKKNISERTAHELKDFLQLLGDWHDQKEAYLHLVTFAVSRDIKEDDLRRVDEIKSKLLSEKGKLFDRVVSKRLMNPSLLQGIDLKSV